MILPKFDPHALWDAVERHRVNVLSVIGDAMARPLMEALAAGGYDTSSLIPFNSTAALFSPAVKDACARALPNVFLTEAIGSTETGFTGIALDSADDEHRGGPTVTAGPDVIVIDEAGGVAARGRPARWPAAATSRSATTRTRSRPPQMFTEVNGRRYAVPGDWARVEDDGTITLLGRGNTCVNTGGEKVFPEEVEGALKSHPDVFDALVLGVPDDRLGQRVAALVQLRAGATADAAALEAHVHGQLAGYKAPRTVWFVDSIGRTVSGKADYGWARHTPPSIPRHPGRSRTAPYPMTVRTPLCDLLGIEHPIVGFTPSEHVAAAVSRAGGLGVLGCVRFNDPAELDEALDLDGREHRRPAVRHRRGHAGQRAGRGRGQRPGPS